MIMKPHKHQCTEVHENVQSFVLRLYNMHELILALILELIRINSYARTIL